MKFFGTWSIFYPACLKVNLRPNWKRRLGTLSYAASHIFCVNSKKALYKRKLITLLNDSNEMLCNFWETQPCKVCNLCLTESYPTFKSANSDSLELGFFL